MFFWLHSISMRFSLLVIEVLIGKTLVMRVNNILEILLQPLRSAIASTFYGDVGIKEDDIFVSDGAKCDISRLQVCMSV